MKNNFYYLIGLLHQLRERITPSQDSPVSSYCLTLQRINQFLRKGWCKVSHRKAITGELENNSLDFSSEWSTFISFMRSWTHENSKSSTNLYQKYTTLFNDSRGKSMYSIAFNEYLFNNVQEDIKSFNVCNTENIQQTKCKPKKSLYFRKIGEIALNLSNLVENKWDGFSEDEKEKLISLAYKIVEPHQLSFIEKIKLKFMRFTLHLEGLTKDVNFCLNALDQLADNVLNAIELNNSDYQLNLLDMLEEVKNHPEQGEIVTSGNIREKLRRLSDQAYTEF